MHRHTTMFKGGTLNGHDVYEHSTSAHPQHKDTSPLNSRYARMQARSHVPRRHCSIEWHTILEISIKFRGCSYTRISSTRASTCTAHGHNNGSIRRNMLGSETRTECQEIREGRYAVQNVSPDDHHQMSSPSFRGRRKRQSPCANVKDLMLPRLQECRKLSRIPAESISKLCRRELIPQILGCIIFFSLHNQESRACEQLHHQLVKHRLDPLRP